MLFGIAEEIGKVWELLGDPLRILPLLEKLSAVEETVVRDEVRAPPHPGCQIHQQNRENPLGRRGPERISANGHPSRLCRLVHVAGLCLRALLRLLPESRRSEGKIAQEIRRPLH